MPARRRFPAALLILVSALSISGCARKAPDPLDAIKAMVPRLQQALNRRDIAGLQRLGTKDFPSNRLLIDVFGGAASDTVAISIAHLRQVPGEAELLLAVTSPSDRKELTLTLTGNGTWRMRGYQMGAAADSTDTGSAPPDSG